MRKFKKHLLCFILLIPMLVLMVHDIIPHYHHIHQLNHSGQISTIQVHHHFHSDHQDEGEIPEFNHEHNAGSETCCILTHHRVQKDLKYQIFLQSEKINYDFAEQGESRKFRVQIDQIIPEPYILLPLRRGPPTSKLS